ncbi:MAG: PilZ domain-containing protein [Candidatus Omnitrophica bacterium]|nr:PilZ domain-containing protein [Candidatus Omnitrophota bacterium]
MTDSPINPNEREDRRKYPRVEKHFIVTFFEADKQDAEHSISQLRNISRGGVLFSSSVIHAPGKKLQIMIKTPYMASTLSVQGTVLECKERIPGVIYEIRVEIKDLDADADAIFKKIEEAFLKSQQDY